MQSCCISQITCIFVSCTQKQIIMKKYLTLIIVLLFTVVQGVWAQTDFGNVPDTVDPNDATITKMGHLTMTMGKEVVVDPQTQQVDTIIRVKKVERDTETGTAQKRMARRQVPHGSDFLDKDTDWWLDMWYFTYNYPSVNADGEDVILSAMACMPDEDCKHVNNVIIGCHVTITSNAECPSRYIDEGSRDFLRYFRSLPLGSQRQDQTLPRQQQHDLLSQPGNIRQFLLCLLPVGRRYYCRRSCTRRTMCQCVCAELRWWSSNGNLIHPHILFEWRGVV